MLNQQMLSRSLQGLNTVYGILYAIVTVVAVLMLLDLYVYPTAGRIRIKIKIKINQALVYLTR